MAKKNRLTSFSFLSLSLLMLCTFQNSAFSQQQVPTTFVNEATYVHVYPEKLSTMVPLSNPGIGIEQASLLESRNGKTQPTYSGAVGPRNTSLDGVATIRYIRSDWVSLEPAKGEYHWTTLDNNINDAWSKGQQIGFSINCASPVLSSNYWQNVPAWYINDSRHVQCTGVNSPEGCTYYKVNFTNCGSMGAGADCTDNWVVNHDDPIYIQAQLDLIEALRLRYDNKEWAAKWAYLDMRNWGVWGEWQTDEAKITGTSTYWPEPSLENKKAIIDAFLKFEYIPVIANFKDEESWVYALERGAELGKTIGWRTDGIDVTAWKINPAITKYSVIRDGWKTGPIYGEVMGTSLPSDLLRTNVLPRAYLWHMSGFNNKWESKYISDATYKSLIDEFRAKGGYRLAIDEVILPASIQKNTDFSVAVKLINSGIAPLYRKYYKLSVKLTPVNGGEEKSITFTEDITKILPGETMSFVAENQKITETGNYKVYVGITSDESFNPAPLPVTLANTESINTGNAHWCLVGNMDVTQVPEIACLTDITANTNAGECSASVSFEATATGIPAPDITYKIGETTINSPHVFPIGTTTVEATATNIAGTVSCDFPVTVKVNACGTYIGEVYANTSGPAILTTTIDLAVVVSNEANCDINPDDIDFSFNVSSSDGQATVSLIGSPVFNASTSAFTQKANVTIKAGNVSSILEVSWSIGKYYSDAQCAEKQALVTVAVPGSDFSSGGGFIYPENPNGLKPAVSTNKNNFGYNIKWTKNYSKLNGNFNTIWRANGVSYQAKSNSASVLIISNYTDPVTGCDGYKAQITYSNVNMKQLDCLDDCWSDGNGTVILTVYDFGKPGSNPGKTCEEKIGFAVKTKTGALIYSTNTYTPANADPVALQTLDGGNIQVLSSNTIKSAKIATAVEPEIIIEPGLKVYPNPFNEELHFEFVSPQAVDARIDLYDISGRLVKTIVEQPIKAGVSYKAEFKPKAEISGTYIYRVTMGDNITSGKVEFRK